MGRFSITSETNFAYPPEVVYDYATDPHNWHKNYKGSGGVYGAPLSLPLKVGDVFHETADLPPNTYTATWTLITAVRPRKWVFQQVDAVGRRMKTGDDGTATTTPDESTGVPGIVTISYTFDQPGEGVTLFTRNATAEFPKGVGMPDDLLVAFCRPQGIDGYHAMIKKELDKIHGKAPTEGEET